jgi:NTP pyrophosphatase (non-canonical NTP hydrolase)
MKKITMYSWGYYGWGSSAKEFVRCVDEIEKKKGFKPPFFVDIRAKRNGKAHDFVNKNFEKITGTKRYEWKPELGNAFIGTPAFNKGKIKIKEPKTAEELLELAEKLNKEKQHIIFFSNCDFQKFGFKKGCHRYDVGSLLLKYAKKQKIELTLEEWPGGEPKKISINLNDKQFRTLADSQSKNRLQLGEKKPSIELIGLP